MGQSAPAFPKMLGHYRIVEKIGEGGMGQVFRAHDEHLDREVAIKLLPAGTLDDEDARRRFRKEALSLSKLNHPNIATVHDFDTQDDVDFLVTELVPGATLAERLHACALSVDEVIALGIELAQGLAAAHAEGVVHRDLKPENLKLTTDGRLKILDFGLAKLVHRDTDVTASQTFSDSRQVSGTLPYMAPEQLRAVTDVRTDLYGAGAVLYELATGQRMFPDAEGPQLIDAIFHRAPKPPGEVNPNMPPALEVIILRALDKNPERRQQSAGELLAELQRLTRRGSAMSTAAAGPWARRWWWPLARRPRALLLSAGVVALAVMLAVWINGRTPALAFAARDFVLLADFDNETGDAVFDKSLGAAFATSLRQSQFANVYSRQRVRDTLKRMQRSGAERIDEALAREIAVRENLKVFIVPSISGVGQNYRVAASIRDAASGRDIKTEVVKATSKEDVLEAVDKLAAAMRRDLGESLQTIAKSKPLTQVTTKSLEALRQYSLAIEKHMAVQIQEARVYYENALRIDPTFTAARASLGMMHIDQATLGTPDFNPEEGRRLLNEAIKHTDELTDEEKFSMLAFYANAIEHNPEKAVGYYKALQAIHPDYAIIHTNIAWIYAQTGRLNEAITENQEAIRLDPKLVLAHVNLMGIYLYRQCRLGPAIETCNKILELDPQNAYGHHCLGWAALGKGDAAQAVPSFEKAVAADPQFTLSVFRLAHTHRLLGHFQQAIDVLLPMAQLSPNDNAALYDLGVNYDALRDHARAREYFERLRLVAENNLRQNPKNAGWMYVLGSVYARLGDKQRAAALTQRMTTLAPGMHFEAASLLSLQGRKKEAVDQLELAVQNGYWNFIWIKIHPDFDFLHGDARFEALLKRGIKM